MTVSSTEYLQICRFTTPNLVGMYANFHISILVVQYLQIETSTTIINDSGKKQFGLLRDKSFINKTAHDSCFELKSQFRTLYLQMGCNYNQDITPTSTFLKNLEKSIYFRLLSFVHDLALNVFSSVLWERRKNKHRKYWALAKRIIIYIPY